MSVVPDINMEAASFEISIGPIWPANLFDGAPKGAQTMLDARALIQLVRPDSLNYGRRTSSRMGRNKINYDSRRPPA
jgi:hypothetical protein